jgi:rubrerythrin
MSEESGPMETPGKPSRPEKNSGELRLTTRSERVRNYCIGIGALSALILGLVATFKGEPVAEKTWNTLRTELNKQSVVLKRLHSRVVFMQAHEEGRHAAEIQLKLETLQKRYDALKATGSVKVGAVTLDKKCADGHIEVDGKCKRVAKAVAKQVQATAKVAATVERKLVDEKRRADKLESKLKKIKQQQKDQKGIPELIALPKKLSDT